MPASGGGVVGCVGCGGVGTKPILAFNSYLLAASCGGTDCDIFGDHKFFAFSKHNFGNSYQVIMLKDIYCVLLTCTT